MRRALIVCLLLVAGCGFLSKKKSRIFPLDIIPPAPPVAAITGAPIGIDVLEIPPALDRKDIVVRKQNGELDVRGTDQWSASLRPLLLHVLAHDLAARLPEGMMILPGEPKPLAPMRSIDVVVEELSAGPTNVVVLNARWVLRVAGAPEVTHHERVTVNLPSLESGAVAEGMSKAVGMFADRVAGGLAAQR